MLPFNIPDDLKITITCNYCHHKYEQTWGLLKRNSNSVCPGGCGQKVYDSFDSKDIEKQLAEKAQDRDQAQDD